MLCETDSDWFKLSYLLDGTFWFFKESGTVKIGQPILVISGQKSILNKQHKQLVLSADKDQFGTKT